MSSALTWRKLGQPLIAAGAAFALLAGISAAMAPPGKMTTGPFAGAKVNGGTVTHTHVDGRHVLTLSDDFKTPDTPDPHWQVVDSKGHQYLLQRLMIKDDKLNKTITVPSYIPDVARVQIWCAWAEVVLGETAFEFPIR